MHLHSHAFVTPHDRSGCLASEEVAEIVARAAPPDRRQPCASGREREIVAPLRGVPGRADRRGGGDWRQRCRGAGGRQRARRCPAGARRARPGAGGRRSTSPRLPPPPTRRPSARSRGWRRPCRRRPPGHAAPRAAGLPTNGTRNIGTPGGRSGSGAAAARRRPGEGSSEQQRRCPAVGGQGRSSASMARLMPHGPGHGGDHAEAAAAAWPGPQPPTQGSQPLLHAEQAVAAAPRRLGPSPASARDPGRRAERGSAVRRRPPLQGQRVHALAAGPRPWTLASGPPRRWGRARAWCATPPWQASRQPDGGLARFAPTPSGAHQTSAVHDGGPAHPRRSISGSGSGSGGQWPGTAARRSPTAA
jgi:hypothetical protein